MEQVTIDAGKVVTNAVGVRIYDLPITAEKVLSELRRNSQP